MPGVGHAGAMDNAPWCEGQRTAVRLPMLHGVSFSWPCTQQLRSHRHIGNGGREGVIVGYAYTNVTQA
jgi:hypothetical protein